MINPARAESRPETAVQPGVLLARRIVPGSPFCTSAFIMSMGVSAISRPSSSPWVYLVASRDCCSLNGWVCSLWISKQTSILSRHFGRGLF